MEFRFYLCSAFVFTVLLVGCGGDDSRPKTQVSGGEQAAKTKTLEAGANVLQDLTPVKQIGVYLVGFHPMKDDPQMQMEAHHYCNQVNEDFAQCVLYDGNTKEAHLNGVEYIISEKLFNTLPADEKQYWHPHNFEVLSGQLVAPGLPDTAEHSLMAQKMNSYGKTWHLWQTDSKGQPKDQLPLGPPHLAWSFNRDGEMEEGMLRSRDERMKINSQQKRDQRKDLTQYAHPQSGVDALKKAFPNAKPAPEGVRDAAQK